MLRLRMVTLLSGVLVAGLGVASAQAQSTTTAAPTPSTAPTVDEAQTTPYDAAKTQTTERTTTTTTTTTTPTQPIPTQQINVQAPAPVPAPVIVETPAPIPPNPIVSQPVVVHDEPVNVTVMTTPRYRRDMAISVGGGVSDFTDSSLRSRTGVSGAYEARVGFGMSSLLAIEAAYVGTAGEIDTLGLDDKAMLISNGVEGLARINLGTYDVQPYVIGGASWVRYSVVNDSFNTSDVRDGDSVLAIPFGGGVSTYIPNTPVMLDARFTYRATFDDELVRPTPGNSDGSSLNNWLATLRVGYTF